MLQFLKKIYKLNFYKYQESKSLLSELNISNKRFFSENNCVNLLGARFKFRKTQLTYFVVRKETYIRAYLILL